MAASTITRATWTNDTGTAANPNGDGTIINNTRLQDDIYAKIDEMFAGAGAYAAFTFGGRLIVEGFGAHALSAGGTGVNSLTVRNTTAGTGNFAGYYAGNNSSPARAYFIVFSSTFSSAAPHFADGLTIGNDSGAGGISIYAGHVSGTVRLYAGGGERARLTPAGSLFLNDTTDGDLADHGICVNHAAATGQSLTLKNSGVSRTAGPLADADTFGALGVKTAGGGLAVYGASQGSVGVLPSIELYAHGDTGTGDTTKNSSSQGYLVARASKNNTVAGANENLLTVINFNQTRFILDADGDSHQDVSTAWTNFDDHDDIALLHALSAGVSRKGDPLRRQFGQLLQAHRATLERARIVTFNRNGHHFINWSRAHMLTIGAVRQVGLQLQRLEQRLKALEA